jgi:pimeloyl-ACP methyl ester carboxylesterase
MADGTSRNPCGEETMDVADSAAAGRRAEELLYVRPQAAVRGEVGEELRTVVHMALTRLGMTLSPPGPRDYVLLLRGMPVAPWVPPRPGTEVWGTWLRWLEQLWTEWSRTVVPPDDPAPAETWDTWRAEHVLAVQVRQAGSGLAQVATLLRQRRMAGCDVHLIGHSVGGAAALAFLARSRIGALPPPLARIRTVVTLDAAVAGVAGAWSGARRCLGTRTEAALHGLGAWAARRGTAVLTACNERDVWSHRAIADLPYVGLTLGPARVLRAQLDGTIHGWLRRTPLLVEALWGAVSGVEVPLALAPAPPSADLRPRASLAETGACAE